MVVHHGGAGTTAAAARAGRPQVICPFVGGQPFWGRRMQNLGVAPAPVGLKSLDVRSLAAAVRQAADDAGMAETARRLGVRIRENDGVTVAVDALEQIGAAAR